MESNIKREYDKVTNADGSITLRFKSFVGPDMVAAPGCMSVGKYLFAGGFAFLFVTALVFDGLLGVFGKDSKIALILAAACGILAAFFTGKLVAKLWSNVEEIVVFPNKGIRYGKTELSIADIKTIGVTTQSMSGKSPAYIFAKALGQEIKLSKYVPQALAEAIAQEIQRASGASWS